MGLEISVGVLAQAIKRDLESAPELIESFQEINEVLRENNLPEHHEPQNLPLLISRSRLIGFPYSFLHYLRRAAAYSFRDQNWRATEFPEYEDPMEDGTLDSELHMFDSHLLCHSDCQGYYLPVDFNEVIFEVPKKKRIPGDMLGSSYKLIKELVRIAPALGIKIENGELSDSEAENINQIERESGELFREKIVWLTLFEAARLSLEYKTAIVFR